MQMQFLTLTTSSAKAQNKKNSPNFKKERHYYNFNQLLKYLSQNQLLKEQNNNIIFNNNDSLQYIKDAWFEEYFFLLAKEIPGIQGIALNIKIDSMQENTEEKKTKSMSPYSIAMFFTSSNAKPLITINSVIRRVTPYTNWKP